MLLFFLPRHAKRKRGLCCRPVSVCQFVCYVGVLCRRLKISSNSFLASVAPSFSVFHPEHLPNSKENPFSEVQNIWGWVEKNCDFRLKSPFISETVRDAHGCYETLIGTHWLRYRQDGTKIPALRYRQVKTVP